MSASPPVDPDRILHEAAEWLVEQHEGVLTGERRRHFDAWCGADDAHARAYRECAGIWESLPEALAPAACLPLASNDDTVSGPAPMAAAGRPGRRIAMFSAVAASCAAVILLLSAPQASSGELATRIGEARKIRLPDGSTAALGPATRLTYRFSRSERRLALAYGEIFFDVASNPARPFIVDTGASAIRVIGTQFDTKREGGKARVAVMRGIVEIRADGGGSGPILQTLRKGQSTEIVTGSRGEAILGADCAADGAWLAAAHGWRQGWLVYDNMCLGEVVGDLNRYYAPGIRLSDTRLARLRITASFRINQIPQFVTSLDQVYPVQVASSPGGGYSLRHP